MKRITKITSLGILLMLSFITKINAQQTDENTLIITKYFQNNTTAQTLGTINLTNQASANSKAITNSELNILQNGNYNLVNIKTTTNNQNIAQVGNNNSYEFISYYGRDDLNFGAQQIGNGNFIQILGENSLINNMKIIQKSDYKTITITNY